MPISHLYLVASAFLLALGSVLAKYLLSADKNPAAVIDPLPFLTLQFAGGITFLLAVRLIKGWVNEPLARLRRPLLAGLVLGAGSIGTIMALALISASEASLVFATQPALMLGLAWLLLGERFDPPVAVMCLAAVIGVVIIVLGGGAINAAPFREAGLAFAFMSTLCAALYTVWMRGLGGKVDFLTALIVVQVAAGVFSAAVWASVAWSGLAPTRTGTPFQGLSAFVTGAIHYGAAFHFYLIGLQTIQASRAGIYLSLVPVFTIALAFVMLAERLDTPQWIGSVMVIAAVAGISAMSARDGRNTDATRQ